MSTRGAIASVLRSALPLTVSTPARGTGPDGSSRRVQHPATGTYDQPANCFSRAVIDSSAAICLRERHWPPTTGRQPAVKRAQGRALQDQRDPDWTLSRPIARSRGSGSENATASVRPAQALPLTTTALPTLRGVHGSPRGKKQVHDGHQLAVQSRPRSYQRPRTTPTTSGPGLACEAADGPAPSGGWTAVQPLGQPAQREACRPRSKGWRLLTVEISA